MKIKDMAQTVILICCLVVIPVFSFSFFLYSKADLKYYEILDKSFTATFGFFGGTATLAAAYIASRLFNDWREQEHVTFIRQLAHDSSKDVANLIMFMLDFDKTDLSYLTKLKTMHSLITVNLDILDKNLKDPELKIAKDNFSIFFSDFLSVVKDNIHDDNLRKTLIRDLVKSFSAEYNCISKFTIIGNIHIVKALK